MIVSDFADEIAESTLLGGLESWKLEGVLLFAKAKRSEKFFWVLCTDLKNRDSSLRSE